MLKICLIFALSYFLGSIPTGFIVAKFLRNIDLRECGSGSTGATNVLRNVGKWPALFVFIADVLKGFYAVKIAYFFLDNSLIEVLAGLFAISGHIWPFWLKGKGGKAVATGLGMFLALSLKVGFSSLGIFLVIISTTKIVSLSSIIAALFLPFLMYLHIGTLNHPYTVMSILISILVIWKHRSNIERLRNGTEPKINSKD
tara:strand:- start:1274 stop:1873 length:600 start_codon:yes stop_codon:yes gene_type:complete